MMKLFRYSVLLLAALSVTTSANAFENQLKLGVGSFKITDSEVGLSTSVRSMGEYMGWVGVFSPNIAVEVRLGGTHKKANQQVSLQAAVLSALLKPTMPIGDTFELYGLVGASSVAITRQLSGSFLSETVSKSGLSYGFGADVRVTKSFLVGAEWLSYIRNVNYGPAGSPINMSVSGATANIKYEF